MHYSIQRTDRATVQTFDLRNQRHTIAATKELLQHRTMGPPLQRLVDGAARVAEELAAKAPDLTHTGAVKLALQLSASHIAGPFKEAQAAAPRAVADLAKREAPVYQPRFDDASSPAVRVEMRQYARGLSLPKLLEAVRDDATMASAIVEGGPAMSGLPADIFERVRNDMALGNAVSIMLRDHGQTTAPTADDPIGGKPDLEAARDLGERTIAAWKAERDTLATVPALLASIVTAVALMTDQSRADAFAGLTA